MCLGGGEAGAIQSYIMKMRANASKQTARQNKKGLPVDLVFNLWFHACESLGCVFLFQIHHLYPITLTAHTGNLIY